ncbi:hypothetical protein [Nocardia sp. NBC_00511]|uniref:hypothetical protein n=1 Tax=Nocardia sp. NBC_00511 TaxID=2903591 RepID=UPI0030E21D1A
MTMDVRAGVAARRTVAQGVPLYYLSLFEDEIDERLEGFLSAAGSLSGGGMAQHPFALEPTDAVVIAAHDGTFHVRRGGASNFPLYWTCVQKALVLSTTLPIDSARRLSVSGLLASVAVVSVANQNEPNLSECTPLAGWFRCRRGAVTHLSAPAGSLSERPVDFASGEVVALDRGRLIAALRSAAGAFGERQAIRPRALLELSGGFDSTIAAVGARAHGVDLFGVSESMPFYEFRFEEGIQDSVANILGITRVCIDGTKHFVYAPTDWRPRLDEPSIGVLRLKRDLTVARVALQEGIDRIIVGHGGDQLFAEELLDRERSPRPLNPGAFSDAAWRRIQRTVETARLDPLMKRSTLTFSHSSQFDVAFKEKFGITTRSPFTDVAWIRCGLAWARLSDRSGPDKTILAEAFASDLPEAVTHRRGKVPWDGVTSRGYAAHKDHILAELDRGHAPLERIGFNLRWLHRRVQQLADGTKSTSDRDDKEIIASYALAHWLNSWGIVDASDCFWAE